MQEPHAAAHIVKVLLTGTSSFTGLWFARALAERGHELVVTFRGADGSYEGVRARRVTLARDLGRAEFGCTFGGDRFLEIAAGGGFDVLCHHAAEVSDYKSPDFDVAAALANNTAGLRRVFETLRDHGCRRTVATGSVFEHDEGTGGEPRRAFSPYGLSKGLSWQVLRYFAGEAGLRLGKFVIPNPFGPHEEPRFTSYLVRNWADRKTPSVATPAYLRDNIHARLLALAYARFTEQLSDTPGCDRLAPCGYIETQGAFAERFAREMRPRLGLPCELELAHQTEFPEPRLRTNTDILDAGDLGFDEAAAWDELATYYQDRLAGREP
ncbi:MAG: NAD(P)-dependent oxidoreductase [Planctomycetota bacterium]